MATRINYVEIDGEMQRVDTPVASYCDCQVDPRTKKSFWQPVPTTKDPEGTHLCGLCGSYVIWTTAAEISNNDRR